MKTVRLFLLVPVAFVVLLFGSSFAQAGWFGPSNYDECVLERMKGQAPNLISTARSACIQAFPQERVLVEGTDYKKGQLKHTWCDTSQNSITICIDENNTNYKFTKLVIKPVKIPCENVTYGSIEDEIEVKSPMFGNKYVAEVANARNTKCVFVDFWGK
jgi:hypothetical protein